MNEEVLRTMASARWNESVTLNLEEEASKTKIGDSNDDDNDNIVSSTILLVPQLDKEQGGIKWENANRNNNETTTKDSAAVSQQQLRMLQHLSTKKWIFPMLHDHTRNELYDKAIERASAVAVQRYLEDIGNEEQEQLSPKEHSPALASDNKSASTTTKTESTPTTTPILSSLDIGSGSGLLALLSQRHLTKHLEESFALPDPPPSIEITSLEMAAPMADIAREIVRLEEEQQEHNDSSNSGNTSNSLVDPVTSSVKIVEAHSCQIPKNYPPSYLCTSELLESGLLGEGWIPALRDAWDRHLHPRAVVVPQKARVCAMVVEGVSHFVGPNDNDEDINLPRLVTTAIGHPTIGYLSDGAYDARTGHKQGVQVEVHAQKYLESNENGKPILQPLSDPLEGVLSIDVTSPSALQASLAKHDTKFRATHSGTAEGILFWWELDLYTDKTETLTYSTQPLKNPQNFQDHWHHCLYVFPPATKTTHHLTKGSQYTLVASHDESRVHFGIEVDSEKDTSVERASKRAKISIPSSVAPVASPFRCWQLNDRKRSKVFRDGIRCALQMISSTDPIVLDVSDFSLCAMTASLLGASTVLSIESSSGEWPMAAARVAQIGNGLPKGQNRFEILQCHAESLTHNLLKGHVEGHNNNPTADTENSSLPRVDLVVGEPYYEILEGWPIETALNYFYTIRMLRRKQLLNPSALCVPARAKILACGIESSNIFDAYQKELANVSNNGTKKNSLCGFDHTPLVNGWRYDTHGVSLPLWEYNDVVPVTEIVDIAQLDYEGCTIQEGNWVKSDTTAKETVLLAPYTKPNCTCHAIAYWVDYQIRTTAPALCSSASNSTNRDTKSAFATLSTGFGDSLPSLTDNKVPSSKIPERQTVQILAMAQPTTLGASLAIPKHGYHELT